MITQRAWLVGVVGFCFYLITIVNDLPSFYYALTWLAAGVLGSSLGIAFLSLIGLRCAWRVPHEIVAENFSDDAGGPVVEMQFANAGTLNKTGVLVEVRLQRIDDEKIFARRFLMEALPSGSSITTALPMRHLRRGRYKVQEIFLSGSDVLGLFSIRKRAQPDVAFDSILSESGPVSTHAGNTHGQTGKFVVGPAALARTSATLSPSHFARGEGGVPSTRLLGQGEDVRGTRLYAAGDDLRHVHWKSTARKGQLVVKEFHHTMQERALVIWDGAPSAQSTKSKKPTQRQRKNRPLVEEGVSIGFNEREWSLRLAASLCRAFLENRRPCALLRLDGAPLGLGVSDNVNAGVLTMNQVSELLADAQMNRTVNLSEAFAPLQASWQGGEIYLITVSPSAELAALVQRMRLLGARVVIGLFNAEDFKDGSARGKKKAAPEYSESLQSLRKAGARVVQVAPRDNSRDFTTPILMAVQEILEPALERRDTATEKREALPVG